MNNKIYIGIDLHKRTQTWVGIREQGGEKVFTQTFSVTPEETEKAITYARKYGVSFIAVVEPVCGWLWVVAQLRVAGFIVHISNPRKVRMISDSLKKTDEEDVYVLAKLLRTGEMYESVECNEETRKHRSVIRYRCFLVHLQSSVKCRLEGVITREGSHLVEGSPSSKKRANSIVASTYTEWKNHSGVIGSINSYVKDLDKEIRELVKDNTTTKRLMTVPGIGVLTAATIYAEVGDFTRFKTPEALASFAGLVPKERSSGGKQRLSSITHTGSKYLRYMMVEAAMRIRDTEKMSLLYSFYDRIKHKGGAMKARVALARKLLTICWYLMKKEQDYLLER